MAGILPPRTIPFEVHQSSDSSQHTEADQYIEEGSVIAPQPADDGGTVELTQVGNYEEANRATHGKSGENLLRGYCMIPAAMSTGTIGNGGGSMDPKKIVPNPPFLNFP